jgi:ribosomal protein S27E
MVKVRCPVCRHHKVLFETENKVVFGGKSKNVIQCRCGARIPFKIIEPEDQKGKKTI